MGMTRQTQGWRRGITRAAAWIGASVALLWLLEVIDALTHGALDTLGIESWQPTDVWSLATAPLIHFGFAHLIANTLPFAVLGFLILLNGVLHWLKVTGISGLLSGLFAFVLNPPHVNTAGASGVIFGYLTYLICRGIVSRRPWQLLLGVLILAAYGSVLWGVLPLQVGVSWQAHLGGALGGILAAFVLDRRARVRAGYVI